MVRKCGAYMGNKSDDVIPLKEIISQRDRGDHFEL